MKFEPATGATINMRREVERLTGHRNIKLLIGGVGESFILFLQSMLSFGISPICRFWSE